MPFGQHVWISVLKTGASGMIAYRYQKKGVEWQWLQTSSRLVYKNSKPDFIICTHRQLMEEEGRDLLGKRTMDFKVSYLDTGLTSTYFTDADQLISTTCGSPSTSPLTSQQRYNRRYKTHLRDFLSTCRTKRKHGQQSSENQANSPTQLVEYMSDSAVAVAAAYSNLNPIYTTPSYVSSDSLYITPPASANFYTVSDNIFHQYRLQSYYSEYPSTPTSYITSNNFIAYDTFGVNKDNGNVNCSSIKNTKQGLPSTETSTILKPSLPTTNKIKQNLSGDTVMTNCDAGNNMSKDQSSNEDYDDSNIENTKLKEEDIPEQQTEPRRQTVLMWGSWQKDKQGPPEKDEDKDIEYK
uniref:Aryl hydrocarbon receptor n=1 Tax=Culex pipiens TaxID=7175 RepID=A0A8D8FAF4_CULPI